MGSARCPLSCSPGHSNARSSVRDRVYNRDSVSATFCPFWELIPDAYLARSLSTSDTREPTKEVMALGSQISDLEAQLTALRLKMDLELASQSMIARLPTEVLSQIFELSVHSSQRMLACIPLVSRLWREVALATPALHTSICYRDTYTPAAAPEGSSYEHIPLLLARSRDARLSVDINYRGNVNSLTQFVTALAPHMSRVNVFKLNAAGFQWTSVFREHMDSVLGLTLQELTLHVGQVFYAPGAVPHDPRIPILDPEQTYLCLHKLSADQLVLPEIWGVSMPHLRTLEIGQARGPSASNHINVASWLAFLRGIPELETLALSSVWFMLDADAVPLLAGRERVHMAALKTISLTNLNGEGVFVCLSCMSIPALESLSTNIVDTCCLATVFGDASATSAFPHLKTLILSGVNMMGCNILPLVRALHRLPTLSSIGIRLDHDVRYPTGTLSQSVHFTNLLSAPSVLSPRPNGEPGWLLPRLTMLAVGGRIDEDAAAQLLKIIHARNAAWSLGVSDDSHGVVGSTTHLVEKIRSLRIPKSRTLEAATLASLRDSVEELQES